MDIVTYQPCITLNCPLYFVIYFFFKSLTFLPCHVYFIYKEICKGIETEVSEMNTYIGRL